jgi:hypothetical protein
MTEELAHPGLWSAERLEDLHLAIAREDPLTTMKGVAGIMVLAALVSATAERSCQESLESGSVRRRDGEVIQGAARRAAVMAP